MAERHSELQRGAPVALDGAVGAVAEQHAHRLRAVALDGHVQRRRAGRGAEVDVGESGHEDAWMVKGGGIGGIGGGKLEHPRQRPGSEWPGLPLGAPSRPEPLGAP